MTGMISRTMVCVPGQATKYDQKAHVASPTTIAVFRQAFAGDTDAWTTIYTYYTPLVRRWVGVQHAIDPEEVVQEAWLAFARYAPRQPSLVQDESLGWVLSYLRSCVKTATISLCRRAKRYPVTTALTDADTDMSLTAMDSTVIQRITIQERMQDILTNDDERMIFQLRFIGGMKPRTIAHIYPDRFPDVQTIYNLTSRLVLRLRRDSTLCALRALV